MWQLLVSGSRPVVSNILSWQFLKLLLMIISKFCIQSYFLSIIVRQDLLLLSYTNQVYFCVWRSLMSNYIYEYQFPSGLSDDPDMLYLMERYWKGLCRYFTVLYDTVL